MNATSTTWAILADMHGRGDRLRRVLSDARAQGAGRVLSLGDVGSPAVLGILDSANAECVFGNWEASGVRGLPSPYRSWVMHWPAQHRVDGLWAAHASPVWPDGLVLSGVVEYLRQRELHWTALFPSLYHSETARWAALAALESENAPVFFHGHTHVQEAWHWEAGQAPRRIVDRSFILVEGGRWLVGVGSVGEPHDGNGACYALYEPEARRVTWRRV